MVSFQPWIKQVSEDCSLVINGVPSSSHTPRIVNDHLRRTETLARMYSRTWHAHVFTSHARMFSSRAHVFISRMRVFASRAHVFTSRMRVFASRAHVFTSCARMFTSRMRVHPSCLPLRCGFLPPQAEDTGARSAVFLILVSYSAFPFPRQFEWAGQTRPERAGIPRQSRTGGPANGKLSDSDCVEHDLTLGKFRQRYENSPPDNGELSVSRSFVEHGRTLGHFRRGYESAPFFPCASATPLRLFHVLAVQLALFPGLAWWFSSSPAQARKLPAEPGGLPTCEMGRDVERHRAANPAVFMILTHRGRGDVGGEGGGWRWGLRWLPKHPSTP